MRTIAHLRRIFDLTQTQLAAKAGTTLQYICHLEKGKKTNPSVKVLERIANVFELTIVELLWIHENSQNLTDVVINLAKIHLIIPLILVRKDGRNFQFAMYDRLIPVIGQSKGVFHAEKV